MTSSSVGHVPLGARPPCVLVLLGFRRPFTNELTDGTTRRKTDSESAVATLVAVAATDEAGFIGKQDPRRPEMSLDLEALETSFDLVAPRGDELMDEFYARLFTRAPSVRSLFPRDMKTQKTMLLSALVLLRKSLRNLDG